MKRKIFYGILGVCLVILLVSAFHIFSNPAPKTNLISVGYPMAYIDCAPFIVAYTKGFFNEHNVTIETVPLNSGNEVKLALSAGQIDIAFGSAAIFFIPISKGVPIKIIAPMSFNHRYLYVRPDNKIRTFEDLIGKTIAISTGGINEYEIRRVLKKENIDATKINFVSIEKVNRPIALMEKKIVHAVIASQHDVAKYSELGAVLLEEWGTKGYDSQDRPEAIIAIDEEFKRSDPQLVEQFIDALIEGHEFIKSNPEEAAEIVSSYIKNESEGASVYSSEDINAMWKNGKIKYNLWYDPTILVEMSKIAVEVGQIDSNLTLEQIYDLSFEEKLKDAQNEIYSTK